MFRKIAAKLTNISLAGRVRIGFGVPLLVVALVGILSYRTASQVPIAAGWVEHTHRVLAKLRDLTGHVMELVNSQRATFASGPRNPQWDQMMARIRAEFQVLHTITATDPDQQARLTELEKAIVRWNAIADQTIQVRDSQGMKAALDLLKSDEVRSIGERVRTLLREIDERENTLLSLRHAHARTQAVQAMAIIGFGTLAAILLGLGAAVWITKRVSKPVQQLVLGAGRIGDGRLDYRIPEQGQDELGALVAAFNSMAGNLQAAQNDLRSHADALAEERNLLRTLIDNLPEFFFVKDTASRFVLANHALLQSLGVADSETMAGKTDFDFFSKHLAEQYRASDVAVLESGRSLVDHEEMIVDKAGKVAWISTTKVPLRDRANVITGLVGICHDITHRREADEKILGLNRDLQVRAAELETVNKELEAFSYSVSHDLRAPLRHIDGYAELLAKNSEAVLDQKGKRYIEVIGQSAKEMGQLIDDLLVFSRMGRNEMRSTWFSLDQLARQIASELAREANGRQVTWKIRELPAVQGDPAMLRLVLVNLMSNALKYSRTRPHAEVEIGYLNESPAETVYFVADNGVGFDMQYVDKLFGVFQRLHSSKDFEGTGIGLANVRRIIHRHGGKTWAEGAVGQGATFYFSLPNARRPDDHRVESDFAGGGQPEGCGAHAGSAQRV